MFSPLAFTLGFALLGALLFTLTLVPVLSAILLKRNVRERHNVFVIFFDRVFGKGVEWSFRNKFKIIFISLSILLASLFQPNGWALNFYPL